MGTEPRSLFEQHGQSVWLDGLRRALVASGELARWLERGVRGVVGSIEQLDAALAGAGDYDDDLRRLVSESRSVREILEELVVADARSAADALRSIYDASGEHDGWACIDLPTASADDASEMIAEGLRIQRAIGRDNVMVRVPATVEGCRALTELVGLGVPTAVGSIFGPVQHNRASAAHALGIEQRSGRGEPTSGLCSIACIEVGAVEAAVERLLRERAISTPGSEREPGRGAARALARRVLADRAELAGTRPQLPRTAWSSTAVTDARVSDTRLIDELVAPGAISIVSLSTLIAFVDHGAPAPALDPSTDADSGLSDLTALGVDLDALAEELLDLACSTRAAATKRLLEVIEARREALLEQAPERQRISLGAASEPVVSALAELGERDAAHRLWASDATLFGKHPDATAIRQRLGWLSVIQMMRTQIVDLESFARTTYRAGFRRALLCGMGGSSAAAAVLSAIYGATPGFLELAVLDSTDPAAVRRAERWADLDNTLFVIASKSGTTLELECFEAYFYDKAEQRFGERAAQHFVAITDPGTPLAERAKGRRYLRTFLNPPEIGGRFSALSFFGMVPAALSGADLRALIEDAGRMVAGCAPFVPTEDNPGLRLGAFLGALARAGRDKLTLISSPEVRALGALIEQLLAESTGKHGRGIVPIDGEPIGGPDAYGKDRAFVYLRFGSRQATDLDRDVDALALAGFPVARIGMLARHDLGGELFRWQIATAIAGSLLELNPFDEPDVVRAKQATATLLAQPPESVTALAPGDRAIADAIRGAESGDYVALLAFIDQTDARDRSFAGIRTALRDRLGVATTLGYGPRYLHSTGQLHKAGPASGIYLLLTARSETLPIPGKAFDFATLVGIQALADLKALASRGRRVLQIDLGADPDAGLTQLGRQLAAL